MKGVGYVDLIFVLLQQEHDTGTVCNNMGKMRTACKIFVGKIEK
jgi:hypothetical protein